MTPAKTPQYDNDQLLSLAVQLLLRVEHSDKDVLPRKTRNQQRNQEITQLTRQRFDKRFESFPPDQTPIKAELEIFGIRTVPSARASNPARLSHRGRQTGCPSAYREEVALIGYLTHRPDEYSGLCGCPIPLGHYTPSQTSISGVRVFE